MAFRALRCFNAPERRALAGSRTRIDDRVVAFFPRDDLVRQVVAALARDRLLPLKEVCESFEFFERTRRDLRAPCVADLAAGHGLTGLLFAAFERSVEQVVLVDTRPSPSHGPLLDAVCGVAPWVAPKVRWVTGPMQDAPSYLPPHCGVVAVHACGVRTDLALDVALACGGSVALMPCCHPKGGVGSDALHAALGEAMASDIHRTLRLEGAGYRVRWRHIPAEITPRNRVIVGRSP